jgi:hypothetical protein
MKKQLVLGLIALFLVTMAFGQTRETRNVGSFTKISFRFPGKLYLRQGGPQKVELEGKADVLKKVELDVEGSKLIIGREEKWNSWWEDHDDVSLIVYITVPNIDAISVGGSGDVIAETKITANSLDLAVSGSGSLTLDADVTGDVEANVSGSGDIELKGKCKNFDSDISGSGEVEMNMAIAGTADFSISGSGKAKASGSSDEVKATISGSGKVLAANMQTNRCDVRISGSGDVEINVAKELNANISGSGSVSYKGDPNKVNSNASGSGSVRKM